MSRKILILSVLYLLVLSNTAYSQDNKLTNKENKEGWQLLFDGKSMTKWRSASSDSFPSKGWKIDNGILFIDNGEGRQTGGDIIKKEQ